MCQCLYIFILTVHVYVSDSVDSYSIIDKANERKQVCFLS